MANADVKHGKALTLYITSYFHDINFQVDHVLTIRGPSFANLKDKRGVKQRQPGPKGYHHWSYFHDTRFQRDHVWTIRWPIFAHLKDKSWLKERQPGPEG